MRKMQRMTDPRYLHTTMTELFRRDVVVQGNPRVVEGLLYAGAYSWLLCR